MSEEDLTKCITRYFKEPNIDVNNLAKFVNYFEDFGKKNSQTKMIQKVFYIAESIMTKDNLKLIIKRYMHIINDVLERDEKLAMQFKYQQAISTEIVQQFINMLKNVFKYGPMDLFLDLKVYRKRWAKRITDQAYRALQTEAQKQLKLDLDKGFPEDTLKKIRKSYQKRQFSSSDLEKYMPISNNQSSNETKKSSAASSSEEEVRPRKSVKRDSENRRSSERTMERQREKQYYDMVNPALSYIPSNSTFGNGYVDPRRPNQNLYHPVHHMPNPNIYPPNSHFLPPPLRVTDPSLGYYPPNPTHLYYQQHPNPYNYGYPQTLGMNQPQPPSFQHYANQNIGYQPYAQMRHQNVQIAHQTYNKMLEKLESMRSGWFFQCKFCGLLMSTNQKYDQHMFQHFSESQKQYQVSHSRAEHTKKASKSLMPTLQEWIQSNRIKANQQNYVVPIEGGISQNQTCLICKGQLKVTWSNDIDSWVYDGAVKTNCAQVGRSICHAQCYHTIDEFEKSSHDSK